VSTWILTSWSRGEYPEFGHEMTPEMKSALTPDKQKQAYESIRGMFGHFVSMEYAETWMPTDGTRMFIFRFKGNFTKTDSKPEIRAVIDANGRLSGFWVRPWKREL
jgi:hypothetical protein